MRKRIRESWKQLLVQLTEERVPDEEPVEAVIGLKGWAGCRGESAPAVSAGLRVRRSTPLCCV